MATREVHDEHIAQIFASGSVLSTPEYVRLIQDAVYLLMDSTVKDKNSASLTDALQHLKDLRIADIAPDDIVAPESAASTHQYYAHRGWNYDYQTDGLLEQTNTAEWRCWTSEQQNEFKMYLAACQKRFMLGKEIVIKSIEKAFPSFSSERAEALARICYYTHIYGDLRWNSKLGYLIDVPQFRDGLTESLTDFTGDDNKEKLNKLITLIERELPDELKFTVPPDGDDAPIEEWKHCLPLDKAMNAVFEYLRAVQK